MEIILWIIITGWYTRDTTAQSLQGSEYSGETCVNGHLYSETTCIKRPLRDVPKEST